MQAFRSFAGLAACAAGAVALTAGVYYVFKRGDKKKSTEALEGPPVDKDPVQRVSLGVLGSNGYMDTPMDKASPEESVAEPEEKNEKDEVSGVEMNTEALYVLDLENRVMELEKLLSEAHRESEQKNKVDESKLKELEDRGTFLEEVFFEVVRESEVNSKELERERQDYMILWSHYETAITSVAEAEDKAKFAEESKAQLQFEKSSLMDKVTTLQRSVEKLEGILQKTHKEEVKLMKSTLKLENLNLRGEVKTLQVSVKKLEEELNQTCRMYEEKLKETEQEILAHRFLKEKPDVMQEKIKQNGELLTECEQERPAQEKKRRKRCRRR